MENEKKVVCPYKAKDTDFEHVFYYGEEILYCDNKECSNNDESKIYVDGETEQSKKYIKRKTGEYIGVDLEDLTVGICKTDGFVDENSELITKIKGSEFFKTLEAEKLKEANKERLAEAVKQFGK